MWTGIFFIPNNIFPWHFQPLHPALPRPTGTHPPGMLAGSGQHHMQAGSSTQKYTTGNSSSTFSPPLFINIADSSLDAQNHASESHSRFLWVAPSLAGVCQQLGHLLAQLSSGSAVPLRSAPQCPTPQMPHRGSKEVKFCWSKNQYTSSLKMGLTCPCAEAHQKEQK